MREPETKLLELGDAGSLARDGGGDELAIPVDDIALDPAPQCALPTEAGYLPVELLGPLHESLATHGVLTDEIAADLALAERALRAGREAHARESLARVRAALERAGGAHDGDDAADGAGYVRSIVLRLDMLQALGDLRSARVDPVAMAAQAHALAYPGDKSFLDCWKRCLEGKIREAANELIQDLGGTVSGIVKTMINNCIDGAVAGLIAGSITGAGALITALQGCLLAINVDIMVQVADFLCDVAWGAAVCAWDCW
ncbi:hypothetical protein FJ250_03385 [bacterium]|nr:hypothetical protein [bacterium]